MRDTGAAPGQFDCDDDRSVTVTLDPVREYRG